MKRPQRKKVDRLLNPSVCADEIKRDMLLAPFDGAIKEADKKWGIDRLPELVSPETVKIWSTTMANLNTALQNGWTEQDQKKAQDDIAACVASALRGLEYMDAEATRTGAQRADTRCFEYLADDGKAIAVIADEKAAPALREARPDLTIFTMREVANALRAYGLDSEVVAQVKAHFPESKVSKIGRMDPKFWEKGGDDVHL